MCHQDIKQLNTKKPPPEAETIPNNPLLKCTICAQRLEDTHFVQVSWSSSYGISLPMFLMSYK